MRLKIAEIGSNTPYLNHKINTMSKEGIKFLLSSINQEIHKLLENPGHYTALTLIELYKLKAYYETKLQESN